VCANDPNVVRIGYFGSYAKGNWGVGSDLDVVLLVHATDEDRFIRGRHFDTFGLPVPVDLLVFTDDEWARKTVDGHEPFGKLIWLEAAHH